jgi:hypothetical protein
MSTPTIAALPQTLIAPTPSNSWHDSLFYASKIRLEKGGNLGGTREKIRPDKPACPTHCPSIMEEERYVCGSGGQCLLRWGQKKYSWACPYFYYSILDDCHSYSIHPVQCNSDRFSLLHDTQIFPILMRLLQPSIWMNIYNVGADRSRDKYNSCKVSIG